MVELGSEGSVVPGRKKCVGLFTGRASTSSTLIGGPVTTVEALWCPLLALLEGGVLACGRPALAMAAAVELIMPAVAVPRLFDSDVKSLLGFVYAPNHRELLPIKESATEDEVLALPSMRCCYACAHSSLFAADFDARKQWPRCASINEIRGVFHAEARAAALKWLTRCDCRPGRMWKLLGLRDYRAVH